MRNSKKPNSQHDERFTIFILGLILICSFVLGGYRHPDAQFILITMLVVFVLVAIILSMKFRWRHWVAAGVLVFLPCMIFLLI